MRKKTQIASALGATVIATSSSSSKLAFAKSLGATHVVNYVQTPNWEHEVLQLTRGKGVDHVVETGGAGTLMMSIAATRMGGLVTVLGILTPNAPIPAELVPSVLFGAKIGKTFVRSYYKIQSTNTLQSAAKPDSRATPSPNSPLLLPHTTSSRSSRWNSPSKI
jgi:NADPH:quinone reductase-like Zn-dependent oxidoreductase